MGLRTYVSAQLRRRTSVARRSTGAVGEHIPGIVRRVGKRQNPQQIFHDPVMGHPEKGCIVAPRRRSIPTRYALPASDIIALNLIELEIPSKHSVNNVNDAVQAARETDFAQGPEITGKTSARAGYSSERFEMLPLLVTAQEARILAVRWWISAHVSRLALYEDVNKFSGLLLVKLCRARQSCSRRWSTLRRQSMRLP